METVASIAVLLVHVAAISGVLLTERRQPSATLAWILALIFLPGIGLLLYFVLGTTRFRRISKRSARAAERMEGVISRYEVRRKAEEPGGEALDWRTESLLDLGRRISSVPPSQGNRAKILIDAAATYPAMLEAGSFARDHIHVQFYIIQPDEAGETLRDALVAKAKEGVKVRLLCDAFGSSSLPGDFWDPLEEAGGEVAWFSPVKTFLLRWRRRNRVDFRNHRKIVIVDGKTGFTGGINVGREYLGMDPDMGDWRDTHIRVTGPAVLSLQAAFAQDWLTATGDLIDGERYYPEPEGEAGPHIIDIIDSGPDQPWSPILQVFIQAMALARNRIWITSPYFIPGPSLENALITAALRGVDVRLLLPSRSDNWIVTLASRTYYKPLLEAGVRIFEYGRGFLHAKTMVVDDWVCSVGSANMDLRSFHLNFELDAFLYGRDLVETLGGQYLADLVDAREISSDWLIGRGLTKRLLCAGARLLSPLL